ncbi:DIP1281 family NlpC/P60 protein [Corynebacterium sp. HMSC28B08]|uniref:DIP1281 family NlpC/P60 protein n=1 Tax=Corynebacterium sp. HMSC28B08 TaxID=1581066 RepID=UPI0008A5FA1E|nr:NlpC/P60 family protein [Corynebacterium sp. HMSC28B08]OFT91513.1 hypothetical protein HMPREF3098_00720 [Corynebacterium sp. HMSC28B08]
MNHRPLSRRHAATSIGRSSRALLACAVSAGMAFQASAHPALAEKDVTVEGYLADLVGKASQTEKEVSSLQLEVGGLRESANKARVDLGRAQSEAQKAQDEVTSARGRLKASDKDVSHAQGKLDDIARSAYTQGGDASPIPLAAGKDAASAALDRSTYIRLAAKKQRAEVDRLELARTQNANHESGLRANRNRADQALSAAVQAHKAAADAMVRAQSQLRGKQQVLVKLLAQQKQIQAKLRAARSAVETLANTKPSASSWEKRRVAEAAAEGVKSASDKGKPADNTKNNTASKSTDTSKPKAPAGVEGYAGDTVAMDSTNSPTPPATGDVSTTAPSETAADTNETTTATTPATESTSAAPTETTATNQQERSAVQQPGAPAGSAIPELPSIPNNFAATSEGDTQRQQAINGLLKAGESAFMAGFEQYAQSGDRNAALNAALQAGRNSAGTAYDDYLKQAQSAGNSNSNPAVPADPASPPSSAQPTAPGTPAEPETPTIPEIPGVTDGTIPGLNPGGTTGNADDSVDTSGTAAEKIERVIKRAEGQMGVTYAWGGGNHHGPTLGIRDGGVADSYGDFAKVGFDCSGLMMYAFAAVGIHLEHYSGYQYTSGRQVPVSEAKRGDMLFWGPGGSQHVALYLGDNKMLEAPQSGDVVKVSDVRWAGIEPMAVRMIE